jgi:peptidoglycan hydrolase-like protein with peptidoglycan-binding domain
MKILLIKSQQGPDIARLRTTLAATLGGDAAQYAGLAQGDVFDEVTEAAVRHWQSGIGIVADGIVGPYCKALLELETHPKLNLNLTVPSVKTLFPGAKLSNVQRNLPYVLAALRATGLTDKPMILATLGTISAETDGFVPISEFPSKYNTEPGKPPFGLYDDKPRLGNNQPGDGYRYRGRGFVQLTGRDNYERYGPKIDFNGLKDFPDLANAPEVAAVLLATFLRDKATAMRAALAKEDYRAARRAVNGGTHGLDRFERVFQVAAAAGPAFVGAGAALPAGQVMRRRDAMKDPIDLRDRAYTPPPVSLPERYPPPDKISEFLSNYIKARLILDQGQEGSCTGFGLACVVNYLRWRKGGSGAKLASVSPRMLYNYARRYDEYAGEDYEGSSCRGALKGWFHHGVCLEDTWPYTLEDTCPPKFGYAREAKQNTLGVYYRIDTKTITDLQAAIQQVGAIYVSANTHDGWLQVPAVSTRKAISHDSLPVIEFDGQPSEDYGHAFALVGFDTNGFIVQNSWGPKWGHGGFALLTYADWLANGSDAWVAALGVPGVMLGQLARTARGVGAGPVAVGHPGWWDEVKAYQHSIVLGNNGRVDNYLTQDELSRSLQYQACGMPDQWFRAQDDKTKRLVLFAHGGLNSEADAISRARALGKYFIGNGCYPLFMVWKTGFRETLGDIIGDRVHRERMLAGGFRDAFADAADLLLESTVGRPLVKPMWSEMKENAAFASQPLRGGDLLVTALQNLVSTWQDDFEIHLVGHSAGSIFFGHLLDLMAARGLQNHVKSLHLYAPACTVQFANRHFAPLGNLMRRTYLDILSDENERDDNVGKVYRKSLLYFISNALENDARTPLLGLAPVFDREYDSKWDGSSTSSEALNKWRQTAEDAGLRMGRNIQLLSKRKVRTSISGTEINASHGCFDNAIDIVERTLQRITGVQELRMPVVDLRGF